MKRNGFFLFRNKACTSRFIHQLNIEKKLLLLKETVWEVKNEKSPRSSFCEQILRLSSDSSTFGRYLKSGGGVRVGRLMEDLDMLAGMISMTHAFQPTLVDKLQVVTASLDRIDFVDHISSDLDILMAGSVTHVGKSSMEVTIDVKAIPKEIKHESIVGYDCDRTNLPHIATARFVMVALDKETLKAIPVPKLALESHDDHRLYELGAIQRVKKIVAAERSSLPPNSSEMSIIHKLYLESKNVHDRSIIMKDTEETTLILTHPQNKNFFGKIFGGYLMRLAYEMAYSTAILTTKCGLRLVAVDDITFKKPVSVGSLLKFKARVDYCPGSQIISHMQVSVIAQVVDYTTGVVETTNDFHFTFSPDRKDQTLPRVLPLSYEESLAYIEGMRRQKRAAVN